MTVNQCADCGNRVGTRSMEVALTGDYSTETFTLTVTASEAALLRKLADMARQSMTASSPITVKEV